MRQFMLRHLSTVSLALAVCGVAHAQGTMSQQDACRPDVFRLCAEYIPDVGEIVNCLRANEPRLSESCHQVMFGERPVQDRYDTQTHAISWSRQQTSTARATAPGMRDFSR